VLWLYLVLAIRVYTSLGGLMKYLVVGHESKARIDLLFKLTKIKSDDVKDAILDHLVRGHAEKIAVALNLVDQGNFNRGLARLNEVAGTVEAIKELDWDKFMSVK